MILLINSALFTFSDTAKIHELGKKHGTGGYLDFFYYLKLFEAPDNEKPQDTLDRLRLSTKQVGN